MRIGCLGVQPGRMIDQDAIRARYNALGPFRNERDRRLFAACEARAAGRGGIVAVSRTTGIARSTIGRGLADLRSGAMRCSERVRRRGGGQKPAIETQPGILEALNELVEPSIRGDPEAALRWVSLSQRHLSAALARRGFIAGQKLVGRLLKRLNFSLQANRKTREGANHPDRNAQFEHINATVKAFQAAGQPVISVDTKKKELVGDFKNGGRELRPKGQPEPVRVHDFAIPELGKAVPYGIYDVSANAGFVNVGISADTGEFSVASIRRWWQEIGAPRYPEGKAGFTLLAGATAVAQVRIDSCMTQSVISCQRALAGTRFAWFKKILAASVMRVYGALARVCWKQWASNRRPACMPWRKTATKRFVLVAFLITARSAMARC